MTETSDNQKSSSIEWLELCALDELEDGEITASALPSGLPLAVYRVGGDIYVTTDRCTHAGASLADEGELDDHTVQCGWHFGTFDIRTGEALTLPCRIPLMTYRTKVENNKVYINPKPNKRFRR